uniref:t-SNARE coiled-coil homology domain-containing protein n=1 Tax=Craspedostauros australis TaxID=1486917 RepID=A0A7R9WQ52_9STRA|mmetsp:Transcript_15605/g.43123  ORF Transcript_15605/g.43123 Transcript_15605/m.43123 type:complete len:205 (+) Transcript_15605:366-980(+)
MAHSYLPFQRYDEEFKSLTQQVQASLQQSDEDGTVHTEALIMQCDELLQQMALEARSVSDSSLKRDLLQQVRGYKSELQSYKDERDRQSLLGGSRQSGGGSSAHRQRLMDQQDMLEQQNSRLDNARKVMEETEQVALEIGEELSHNRETLQSAHGRIHQVTSMTGRAKRIVQSMSQRAVQQKMMLYGLSASVVIVFFILLRWWG